jgi:hypothetical protein
LVAYQRGTAGTSISRGSQSTIKQYQITLAGTDDRVFEANVVGARLSAGVIPAPLDTLVATNILGISLNPAAVAALETNFLVAWHDPGSSNIVGAIFSEGGVTTNILFTNVSQFGAIKAASSENAALISATLTNNIAATAITNFLAVYDTSDHTYSVTSQVLPIVTNSVSIANLGKDFVMGTTLWGEAGPVVALQFVTATAPASAAISVDTGGGITIKFENLEAGRRYRIERSTDLLNWEFLQTVTQTKSLTLPVDASSSSAFYRAVFESQ